MSTAWRKVKLGEVAEAQAGFAFKSERFTDDPNDICLVKGENVSQGRVLWDISKRWPAEEWQQFAKYHLRAGDVVVAMDRPWVPAGLKWALIRDGDPDALLVQRVARLRTVSGSLGQPYLPVLIGSPAFDNYLRPITTGVNVPHVSARQILDFEFSLPPVAVQHRIAAILATYDDLIANNLRRIQILEEMARAIYREWFVHFRFPGHGTVGRVDSPLGPIPEGWSVKRLGEVLELCYGKALKQGDRREGTVPVFGSSGVIGYHDTPLVSAPGLIVGRKGNVGSLHWTDVQFWPIDTVYYVRTSLPLRFFYFDLQSKNFLNNDAAVPGLSRQQAYSLKVVLPPARLLQQFIDVGTPTWELAALLRQQAEVLRLTRDLLLPRLMSGQLTLPKAEEAVPASL